MPYTPNPYNTLQPTDDVFAGTAAAEFRAMKEAFIGVSSGSTYKGEWSVFVAGAGPHPATQGDTFTHENAMWLLKVTVADVEIAPPLSSDAVTWFKLYPADISISSLNGSQLAGHRNKLINSDFSQNARALASVGDDAYCLDRWYVLTESGNVTVAQLTDPESGAIFGLRLTQPDVAPKRMGFAQIIESKNIRQFGSRAMNLAARLRLSTSANIRYAVIEHTGAADVVTSDVVSNWASATFTPGNFFIGGVNIISTGTIAPGAATWGEVSDWDALSAAVKNVIVFIWTEAQVAQNVTLDCSRAQYEPGVIATPHEWRLDEDVLCSRYAYPLGVSRPKGQAASASAVTSIEVYTPAPMRATPAISSGSHNFTAAAGAQVGPFTVVVTSVNRNVVRLDASGGSGLVAGNVTVMAPTAGTFLSAEL